MPQSSRPRLLDLFCGAGDAAMGYHQAFYADIVGIDLEPQPRYPFTFVQGDALEYLAAHGKEFDAIHASPPCQAYSVMHNLPWMKGREYPKLIKPLRDLLDALGKPYVIENVMGARKGSATLRKLGLEEHGLEGGWLCGWSLGRPYYRHRMMATNWPWLALSHRKHPLAYTTGGNGESGVMGAGASGTSVRPLTIPIGDSLTPGQREKRATIGDADEGKSLSVLAAEAMEIDWMTVKELTQAVPPVYTRFIGAQLLAHLA